MSSRKPNLASTFLNQQAIEYKLQIDQELAVVRRQLANSRTELAAQIKYNEQLALEKHILLGMRDRANIAAWAKRKAVVNGDACAILNLSDLHCEEIVRAATVNNLNSYNPTICEKRLERVTERFVYMVDEQHRRTSKIEECVVWLGGDIISGHIHEELIENNAMSPIDACVFGEKLLDKTLKYLLKHGGFKKITVVGNSGNHDRDTKKTRAATRIEHSYTKLIYEHLRSRSADRGEKNVEWLLAEGAFAYLNVLGKRIRFTHGDQVKYQGGLAGLSAPLNRAVMRWDSAIKADFTILGHFHNFEWNRPNNWLINGSLIGTAPYGLNFGDSDPCQSIVVVTKRHGIVAALPIFTD